MSECGVNNGEHSVPMAVDCVACRNEQSDEPGRRRHVNNVGKSISEVPASRPSVGPTQLLVRGEATRA